MERRWWLWGLARELARLGADLVHGPDFAVPIFRGGPACSLCTISRPG